MRILSRILAIGRVRNAKRDLAADPSARRYAELAHELALAGSLDEALELTGEGLRIYPGDAELLALHGRIRGRALEGRTRKLVREIALAPRPALWRELCEALLSAGRSVRAEEAAAEWHRATGDAEAQLYRARARAERFFADRRRDDGRTAFDLCEAAEAALPGDARPWRLRLHLASRAGAWIEARRAAARLLEFAPGDPVLEARFRTVATLAEKCRSLEQALRDVERTGRLAGEENPAPADRRAEADPAARPAAPAAGPGARPLLQALAREPGVRAAFCVRGATALVQGPKGPTAERTARSVRDLVQGARVAARRLGMGQASEVRLEGEFGTLLVEPGELGAGAVWTTGSPARRHQEMLRDLAGVACRSEEAA